MFLWITISDDDLWQKTTKSCDELITLRPESTNEEQSHKLLGVPGDDQVISNLFPAIIFRSVETA